MPRRQEGPTHRVLEQVAAPPRGEPRHVGVTIGGALEAQRPNNQVAVTLIKTGQSKNRLTYTPEVLRASVPMWEGASAFLDHPDAMDLTRSGGRSIRDLAGTYSNVVYDEAQKAIKARLNVLVGSQTGDTARDLIKTVLEAQAQDQPAPNIGISADMIVRKQQAGDGFIVQEIMKVNSADIVVNPSAGGAFDRALEQVQLDAINPPVPATDPAPPAPPTPPATLPTVLPQDPRMDALRAALSGELLTATLSRSTLPQAGQDMIRRQFEGREFAPADLDKSIEDFRSILAAQIEPYIVTNNGAVRPTVGVGQDARDRIFLAWERAFGLPIPDSASDVPRFNGLRDGYIQTTGDTMLQGIENPEHHIVREANEVTTTVIASALSNAMNKALVRDYQGQPKWWEPIVNESPMTDVKEQSRIAMNDFSSLSTVAEFGPYTNLAWGDRTEKYTPSKKGNTVAVTLESIINDDLASISRIPGKLASAAAITINENIAALFTTGSGSGPALDSDSKTVFHADHSNTRTTALSSESIKAASIAMQKQTNSAGKRIGTMPAFLLVPPDLSFEAQVILQSPLLAGSQNNDKNVLMGILQPITVPNWTDPNNWYMLASPGKIESIEVGFLNGRKEPEMFIQDQQVNGQVFTNDAITWKIRWFYGYAWLDYRGAQGHLVAND